MPSTFAICDEQPERFHWIDLSRGILIVFILSIHFIEWKLSVAHREFVFLFLPDFLNDSTLGFPAISGITLCLLRERIERKTPFQKYCALRCLRLTIIAVFLYFASPILFHFRLPTKEWGLLMEGPNSMWIWREQKFIFGIALFCLLAPIPYRTRFPGWVAGVFVLLGLGIYSQQRAPLLIEMLIAGFLGVLVGEIIKKCKINPNKPHNVFFVLFLLVVVLPEFFQVPWSDWRRPQVTLSPTVLFVFSTLLKLIGVICLSNTLMRFWRFRVVKHGISKVGVYALFIYSFQHFFLSLYFKGYFSANPQKSWAVALIVITSYFVLPSLALLMIGLRRKYLAGPDTYLKQCWGI